MDAIFLIEVDLFHWQCISQNIRTAIYRTDGIVSYRTFQYGASLGDPAVTFSLYSLPSDNRHHLGGRRACFDCVRLEEKLNGVTATLTPFADDVYVYTMQYVFLAFRL